jgi:hypothetical protein
MTTPPQEKMPYHVEMKFKYDEVNSLWDKQTIPFITRFEAKRAVKLICNKFGRPKFAPPRIKYPISRYRNIWWDSFICLSGDPTRMSKGWRELVHQTSHSIYKYYSGFKKRQRKYEHSIQQAELELAILKFVISKNWLNGVLKPKVVILSKDEKRLKKLEHYQKLIGKWQTKLKLANTFIRKYNKKVKYLNKN